jgi:flagellar protein FlgJ
MSSVPNIPAALPASASLAGLSRRGDSEGGKGVYNDFGDIAKLKSQSHTDPNAAMKEVAHQFESLFVTMMMKSMRDTLPKDGMFGGTDMESYQQMFDQQLSLDLSRKGSIGLASVIQRQLTHTIAPRGE